MPQDELITPEGIGLARVGETLGDLRDAIGDRPIRFVERYEDALSAVCVEGEDGAEPLARYGNHSPYEVFGRKYHVLASSEGYRERGTASWYGSKFHGRRTSSGEPYDMHLATAAHRSLPLPTYAEVTNLDNGRKVIVKINDRGPFKDGRIIDLSYGAALRLGMISTGTARVEVRAIDVDSGGRYAAAEAPRPAPAAQPESGAGTWLPAGPSRKTAGRPCRQQPRPEWCCRWVTKDAGARPIERSNE